MLAIMNSLQSTWKRVWCYLIMLLSHFSRVRLCNPINGSPPGSAVLGILQARTLEWVAISFSNVGKWKVKVKLLSRVRLFETPWTAAHQAPPSMGFSIPHLSVPYRNAFLCITICFYINIYWNSFHDGQKLETIPCQLKVKWINKIWYANPTDTTNHQ